MIEKQNQNYNKKKEEMKNNKTQQSQYIGENFELIYELTIDNLDDLDPPSFSKKDSL